VIAVVHVLESCLKQEMGASARHGGVIDAVLLLRRTLGLRREKHRSGLVEGIGPWAYLLSKMHVVRSDSGEVVVASP
jgi:hypothetical protein